MRRKYTKKEITKVALEYFSSSPSKLAKQLGTTEGRIHRIVHRLRKCGLNIPHRKHMGCYANIDSYEDIVKELQRKYPDRF